MNKRIEELAFEAGAKLHSEPPMRAVTGVSMTFEQVEKFAELIIRDIHAFVDARDTAQILSRGILKMYGLEE